MFITKYLTLLVRLRNSNRKGSKLNVLWPNYKHTESKLNLVPVVNVSASGPGLGKVWKLVFYDVCDKGKCAPAFYICTVHWLRKIHLYENKCVICD